MPNNSRAELSFQPKVKGYTFKAAPTAQPEIEHKKRTISPFVILTVEIVILSVIFIIFLLILNFFKIISLPGPSLPQKTAQTTTYNTYDKTNNTWTETGTFAGYNEYVIRIKSGFFTSNFQWQKNSQYQTGDLQGINIVPAFLSDLEKPENVGKQVLVKYTKDSKGNNFISTLTLIQ